MDFFWNKSYEILELFEAMPFLLLFLPSAACNFFLFFVVRKFTQLCPTIVVCFVVIWGIMHLLAGEAEKTRGIMHNQSANI